MIEISVCINKYTRHLVLLIKCLNNTNNNINGNLVYFLNDFKSYLLLNNIIIINDNDILISKNNIDNYYIDLLNEHIKNEIENEFVDDYNNIVNKYTLHFNRLLILIKLMQIMYNKFNLLFPNPLEIQIEQDDYEKDNNFHHFIQFEEKTTHYEQISVKQYEELINHKYNF